MTARDRLGGIGVGARRVRHGHRVELGLGEAPLAQQFSRELFEAGVFAMSIGFPTVAQGKARIRVMISAAHAKDDLDKGLDAFKSVGKKLGVI